MSVVIRAYSAKEMAQPFSNDNSYSLPIDFGSLSEPMDGINGDLTTAQPVWIKNIGSEPMSNVILVASDGSIDIKGGASSSTADAFVEFDKTLTDREIVRELRVIAGKEADTGEN